MSGLTSQDGKCSLVLISSSLFVNINGFVATTSAKLCYFNQFDYEVEAMFIYNDNETFITDFQANIDGRKIHKEIRELVSENELTDDLCVQDEADVINVGKLPPNALVSLEVEVLGELDTTENGQALVFTTPQIFTPLLRNEFNNENAKDSRSQAYKFDIKIISDMPCQLAGCHSSSHAIQVDADADAINADTLIITLAEDFRYDRRIIVYFYPAKPLDVHTSIEPGILDTEEQHYFLNCSSPRVDPKGKKSVFDISANKTVDRKCFNSSSYRTNLLHEYGKMRTVLPAQTVVAENVNAVPGSRHFLSNPIIAASFLPDISNYSVFGEYIFMVDRSGSMSGSHICNAKETLVLFLKSLPTSSFFNIVSFGSYFRSLFPYSERYTQDNLEKACEYVKSIRADMGGSELLKPLKAILEQPHKTGYARSVFLLTDGDVSQSDTIVRYLTTKRGKQRIFTFGIGPKISYNTVSSIARSAQGKAYFPEIGSKIQSKVVQCLKEVLKPTLCEIKVEWRLPTYWHLRQTSQDIPFSIAGKRIQLYAAVQPPPSREKRQEQKSSGVKEFWFDEELESCRLGDNIFFSETDDTLDDEEIASDQKDDNEVVVHETEDEQNLERMQNETDEAKMWRKVPPYSSDTSTEDERSSSPLDEYSNGNMSPPEKELRQRNYDTYHSMETSENVIDKIAPRIDINSDNQWTKDMISRKVFPFLHAPTDIRHLSNTASYNDKFSKDIVNNDLKSIYIADGGKHGIRTSTWCASHKKTRDENKLIDFDINNERDLSNKNNKENVIDWDGSENCATSNHYQPVLDDKGQLFVSPDANCEFGCVVITGIVGPDIHKERIPLKSRTNTSNGISMHQIAARKIIDDMEARIDSNPEVEQEIATLSMESRVSSKMTSSMMVDDKGNILSVFQDSQAKMRRRHQLSKNCTNEYGPAILVSCPSIDGEARSVKLKRTIGISAQVSDDDGKYYRIERQDPEGCDQVRLINETRRRRSTDCRNMPAIQRRKIVNTRLTLLTRKMKNAHKLNVFAGPTYIRLILLQSAEGYWQLTYAFARIIGLPLAQLELAAPFVDSTMIPLSEQDDKLGIDYYYDSLALWATALALVYLKRKWKSNEDEWELVYCKAEIWLQKQIFPQGFGYTDVMLAAKQAMVLLEQKYRTRAKSEPVVQLQ